MNQKKQNTTRSAIASAYIIIVLEPSLTAWGQTLEELQLFKVNNPDSIMWAGLIVTIFQVERKCLSQKRWSAPTVVRGTV